MARGTLTTSSFGFIISFMLSMDVSTPYHWFTDESDGIKELKIGTVSGNVTMQLPQGAGFNMMVSTVSGDVSSVFELVKNGSNYVYGWRCICRL